MLILSHDAIVLLLNLLNLRSQMMHFRLAMLDIVAERFERRMGVVVRSCQ